MKKLFLGFFSVALFVYASSVFAEFQTQWFKNIKTQDNWIEFQCESQCFILLEDLSTNDYISIDWTFTGNWWVGYWFINWDKIVPWDWVEVKWPKTINEKYNLTQLSFFSQLPKTIKAVFFVQWNVSGKNLKIQLWTSSLWESIVSWFNEALTYRPYNPRTINFLEWPTWNGRYINEVFFWWIIILTLLSFGIYFLLWKKIKFPLYFWIWILVFFWIFFDFFSTANEVWMYKDVMSATNIMQNGRVGKTGDFYQFLDFAKQNIPNRSEWFFIAPYPFDFEWKYHIYPDVKFNSIDKVKYILFYNPYWTNSPFDFKNPDYSSWTLSWWKYKLPVGKVIEFTDTAKIFIIKK